MWIHLTDFCNQNCPFCFAKEEMTRTKKKEMALKDFPWIIKKFKKEKIDHIELLGGEPTLHSEFAQILKLSLQNFLFISLYTNGLFSEKIKNLLLKYSPRLYLIVNISTPGFLFNKKIRGLVLKNVSALAGKTPLALSIVSSFLNPIEASNLINLIPKKILKKVIVKLNLITPIANDKNYLSIKDFPKIGKNLCRAIQKIKQLGPPKIFKFSGRFRPCMFSSDDRKFLRKDGLNFITQRTSDHFLSKDGDWFHVNSELNTFKCYPLSTIDIDKIDKQTNFKRLKNKYDRLQKIYEKKYILPECKKCLYFGFKKNQCSGPCIGFRINALKSDIRKF